VRAGDRRISGHRMAHEQLVPQSDAAVPGGSEGGGDVDSRIANKSIGHYAGSEADRLPDPGPRLNRYRDAGERAGDVPTIPRPVSGRRPDPARPFRDGPGGPGRETI